MVIVSGFTLYTSVNFSVHFADFQNKVVGKNYTLVFFSFRLFRIVYGKLVFSIIALFLSSNRLSSWLFGRLFGWCFSVEGGGRGKLGGHARAGGGKPSQKIFWFDKCRTCGIVWVEGVCMVELGGFELGRVHCVDCLEAMKLLPDKCVDLVLTDPPYGVGYEYTNYDDTQRNFEQVVVPTITECRRIARCVAVFMGHSNMFVCPRPDWVASFSWGNTSSFGKLGYCQWQPVLFYGTDIAGCGRVNGVLKSDHYRSVSAPGNDCPEHSCAKPMHIVHYFMQRFAMPESLILDPFMGSGTTGVAAVQLGRQFLGFEIDPEYCRLANERIEAARKGLKLNEYRQGQQTLFGCEA